MSEPPTHSEPALGALIARHGWWLGMTGAVAVTLGDFVQLWAVNATRPALGIARPPVWSIVPATVFGSLGLAVYGLGYFARVAKTQHGSAQLKQITLVAGATLGVIGAAAHAMTGGSIFTSLRANPDSVTPAAHDANPLVGVLDPLMLSYWAMLAVAFIVATVGELLLPPLRSRWWLTNPLVVTLGLISVSIAIGSPWADFVIPAAANLAHVVYFWRLRVVVT